jgi:hypothetical protein
MMRIGEYEDGIGVNSVRVKSVVTYHIFLYFLYFSVSPKL